MPNDLIAPGKEVAAQPVTLMWDPPSTLDELLAELHRRFQDAALLDAGEHIAAFFEG